MYFDSVSAALAMDGHGGYVWSAYLVTLLVVLVLVLVPRRRGREILKQIDGEHRRREAQATNRGGDR